MQVGSDDLKVSPKSSLEEAKRDGQVAPPATPAVTPVRTSSTTGRHLRESKWLKAVSDQEREFLQRERRRMNAYKTSLCNSFRDTGRCSYGFQCRFAHGINELLPAPRPHPKYKTQLCNKFTLYGSCPYGSHCQFIHMRPCKMQNDLRYVNFATNYDSVGKHALNYRNYAMCGRPRFCGQKPCAVEVPGPGYCNSLPQYRPIIDSNRLNFNATAMNDLGNLFSTMCSDPSPSFGIGGNIKL
ncbi:unnamed protein product [Onchocerca ochengi]|uniref:C3H1-type domain-containing protein n=2 Tax=Onchocerca ochengi TaxID=42157 RepID=A0A182ENY6_ONCOC|nr:unnamed protein product [Onchocerca ochengi]